MFSVVASQTESSLLHNPFKCGYRLNCDLHVAICIKWHCTIHLLGSVRG